MKNSMYHQVSLVSFNWWIVVAIITVVLLFLAGYKRKFVTKKLSGKCVIVTRIPMKYVRMIVISSTIIFTALLVLESANGILQAIGNTLPNDSSSVYAVILLPIVVIAMVYVYHSIICLVFNEANRMNERQVKDDLIFLMLEDE